MNLGWTEILLVGGVALLLFGPSKLPNLGRSLGEAIRGFKKGISDDPQQDARDVSTQISQNTEKPLNEETPVQETQEQTAKEKDPNKQS